MTEGVEAPAQGGQREGYQLNFELDGTSSAVRENLADILERELLGPIDGPEEEIPFSPSSQYLVGHIAPVKVGSVGTDDDSDDDTDRGELLEAVGSAGGGVEAPVADEAEAEATDDDAEDRAPKQGLMIPSSMGLRFQVPDNLESFAVTASWGTYTSFETDEVTKAGRRVRRYRRTPIEEPCTVALKDLTAGRTLSVPLRNDAVLRIDRYDDTTHGRCLIEIALCNDRETPIPIPLGMWMFQTKLVVDAGGAEVFLPVRDAMEQDWPEYDDEVRHLNLQYRNRLEFAIGRTCSVDWVVKQGSRRATEVSTTWLPVAETPQTRAGSVEGALLVMAELADATPEQLRAGLAPLVDGYARWLDQQQTEAHTLPEHLKPVASDVIAIARQAQQRLANGLNHVVTDVDALRCFRFMNRVMREQRVASQVAAVRAADPSLSIAAARTEVEKDEAKAASWRPFQLAFILMQLPALTNPAHPDRSGKDLARVELLFFPTGGGKTEAYLGLAAFAFAIRRLQGIVTTDGDPLDGRDGLAVLMRYTLRLLTSDQFQRATALVCAAELERRRDEVTWGAEPFRIGLWVGTDVSPKRFEEAEEQIAASNEAGRHRLTVLQIQRCPWCGTPIGPAQVKADKAQRRVFVHCGDDLARCPFAKGGEVKDGLPVLTIDEEIYRLTPAFVIATVDKFARLAREGEAASLFGYVNRRCERHGYVHPDYAPCDVKTSHPASSGLPAASVLSVGRFRPPDLIIQDELHLITGALGTAVGLFEVAVETLCSWQNSAGQPVRPLIVASTATVRNAREQVRGLYGRDVATFPPQVLDVADTYFSEEIPVSSTSPGRRYVGVSAQGVRLSSAEIRVSEVLLSAGQLLFDRAGAAADPYMTLVGYFNATRELAGMSRYMSDDVQNRVRRPRRGAGFPPRYGTNFGNLYVGELTARIASAAIGQTRDQLAVPFDPSYDTTAAFRARIAEERGGGGGGRSSRMPFDVVLATSMLQVGIDIQRLGLMLVVGQPKNTAEYIQASSRVGRDSTARPGVVVTLGNWARPRDLAHFEQFRHYHQTFYSQVEALSVTPFSPTSLDRGIDGVLVSAARVAVAALSPEDSAGRIVGEAAAVTAVIDRLKERVAEAALDPAQQKRAADLLVNRLDRWTQRTTFAAGRGQALVYERTGKGNDKIPLIISPENAQAAAASATGAPFVVANSMREVQPEINVLVSPLEDRLFSDPPTGAPVWVLPAGAD